jgi:methylated-DNA-protein-cysteine methyltransferase-like protein
LKNINPESNTHYQKIWQTVQAIPYGKVATYGQVADLAGLPKRARLVGKALAYTPCQGWQGKVVPWYRVINAQGKISFPPQSHSFLQQQQRLQAEQVVIIGNKVNLRCYQWQPSLEELLFKLTF